MVNVKVVHKGTVRRFTLPTSASWIELEAKLRSLFNIPKLSPFTLSYADEDNDIITLSTDTELQQILSTVKTIKFILKFSTPDDTSDSEDSSAEVWVLEGGNVRKPVSVTDIEADTPDNIPQKNIVSTTNQELQEPQEPQMPQFIETDSHDMIESSSNKRIPVGDNLEKIGERKPVNVLDDDFFKTLNRNKRQTSIDKQESSEGEQESSEGEQESSEGEQELIKDRHESIKYRQEPIKYRQEPIKYRQELIKDEEESTKDDESEDEQGSVGDEREIVEALTLEQDQPRPLRRDLVVNLKQFQTMIELNEDAIKESPQLVASIKDIMDQIRRLDSFRPQMTLFNRPTPIQQTPEPTRSETPPLPIPGKYPDPTPATPILWATKPTEDREGHQQYHNRYDDNHQYRPPRHNVNNYDNNRNNRNNRDNRDNRDNREQRETKEEQDTTDLRVIYGEQLKELREMGIKDEDALVGLLVEHKGNVELVADSYYENLQEN